MGHFSLEFNLTSAEVLMAGVDPLWAGCDLKLTTLTTRAEGFQKEEEAFLKEWSLR